MAFTKQQIEKIVAEWDGKGVVVFCEEHNYYGGFPIAERRCPGCLKVFFMVMFADLPPHVREERLQQLEEATHHAAELIERGKWDLKLFPRPKIKIERE